MPGAAQAAGEESTLTVGMLSEPGSLNPLTVTSTEAHDIINRLFLKLLEEQPDFLGFAPRLARSWRFSEDSLSITFELRDDVRWSDGEPVTAHDVRFTFELQTDTTVAWPTRHIKERIADVEVDGDHTVTFHFTERYPYQLMDANDGVILPRHLLGGIPRDEIRTAAFGRAPVGDGPYVLSGWQPGRIIELAANPDYYEGPPDVSKVIFKMVPDMVSLLTQLKKGEIDLLESIPPDHIRTFQEDYPDVRIYRYPSRRLDFIGWNIDRSVFARAGVRRALTMAIDRDEIITTVWGGYATPCTGPVPPVLWAHDATIEPVPFDPEGAAALLAAEGWTDTDGDGIIDRGGRRFSFEIITNQTNQRRIDVCALVQQYLSRVGIEVTIRTFDFSTFIGRILEGDYDACVLQFKVSTKLDLTDQWHSESIPRNGYNITRYDNPEVDRLIEEARVCLDPQRARELWSRVQRIIHDDQPVTFLAVPDEVTALHARFCNVQPNAISFFWNLRHWKVAPDCE